MRCRVNRPTEATCASLVGTASPTKRGGWKTLQVYTGGEIVSRSTLIRAALWAQCALGFNHFRMIVINQISTGEIG